MEGNRFSVHPDKRQNSVDINGPVLRIVHVLGLYLFDFIFIGWAKYYCIVTVEDFKQEASFLPQRQLYGWRLMEL